MRFARIIKILSALARHRIDRFIPAEASPLWLKILLLPLRLLIRNKQSAAVSLRLLFEELGPVFVKFGQLLSSRKDLFADETAYELQKLQDQVPPFDNHLAKKLIGESLQAPLSDVFARFDDQPLAAASVAQIHSAQLISGAEVVVKIIRPGIDKVIQQDIKVMHWLVRVLLSRWQDAKRLHPQQIVIDYEKTILDELNLHLEAANTNRLRLNWYGSGKLYVPVVHLDYCSENVMVMERIYGLSVVEINAMRDAGVNMKQLAHLGVEIFFTQVFKDNYFHADMHPGNVFVDITNPDKPSYIALDCAIMGSLDEDDQSYLARNLLAFFRKDYLGVAKLHVESGWVPSHINVREFEAVIRAVCEPIFQKPISEISFGQVLISLFQTARQFDMEVQPQLILLQKTLLNIEGIGRQIYPDLDLWETAAPFMEAWMKERMGLGAISKRIVKNLPGWLQQLPDMPQLAFDAMNEIKLLSRNNIRQSKLFTELSASVHKQHKQTVYSRLGGIALLAALAALWPASEFSLRQDALLGAGVLGTLGIYWMFIKS